MKTLKGKIALVTGASRGIGKGIALGLGENRATVYVTGRTKAGGPGVQGLEGSIDECAEAINEIGGNGFALRCDHRDDNRVKGIFDSILEKEQRLDILALGLGLADGFGTRIALVLQILGLDLQLLALSLQGLEGLDIEFEAAAPELCSNLSQFRSQTFGVEHSRCILRVVRLA